MPYIFLVLCLLIMESCGNATLPSEQVPVTKTVNKEPTPTVAPVKPVTIAPVVAPSPQPNTSTPDPGNNGTMTMENLDDVQVTMNPSLFLSPEQLLEKVQQSIIPVYKNWVLFKNGTYIILDDISNIPDVGQEAIRLLAAYRPKSVMEKPSWDYSISHLERVEGWSVYGNGYGIYTYVHPSEMVDAPAPPTIIVFSKNKRMLDEANPEILYISSAEGIRAY
ncbi:MAG: hypothetical protein AB8E82_10440 [Aureispira sp.]